MLKLSKLDPGARNYEIVVVPVCEDASIHNDRTVLSLLAEAGKYQEFKGKKNQTLTLYERPELKARRVLFAGVGALEKSNAENLRSACGKCVGIATEAECVEIAFVVPNSFGELETAEMLRAMMEGAYLANFKFEYYKGEKKNKPLREMYFLLHQNPSPETENLVYRVETVCDSLITARNWVTTPSNDKIPARLAEYMARRAGNAGLSVQTMTEKELREKGFGAILAVGAGSGNPPRLLVLEHRVEGAEKTVALIGKGVTFDSGGMNLKPGKSQATMKSDMAGAAAVVAAMLAMPRLKTRLDTVALVPIVENMLSGTATRTGDVIRSYSGKTIEIGNTDAEGRLILADAISYAQEKYSPDIVVDLATLTGACVTALGEKIAGVFSNDDRLAEEILHAGKKAHEPCWRLPLAKEYRKKLDSDIADIGNMPDDRAGAAITAALFLTEFVKEGVLFAHIDIAGPAYDKTKNDFGGAGGTGFGVGLLCELLERL